MINETVLLESRTLRDGVADRTDVLDRVKALSLLPDGTHVTTAMIAAYFQVGIEAIKSLVKDHREELDSNGYRVLTGPELRSFKDLSGISARTATLALFSRRAVLNVAMLLRDSEVARQVRTYLLDMEYLARTGPVENFVHRPPNNLHDLNDNDPAGLDDRIDRRITDVLGKTVVPMLNALIETAGEQRRDLISVREDMRRAQGKLAQHTQRLHRLERAREQRPLGGVMAAMDAMTWREFEQHIAGLLRRDGCTDVRVHGGSGDRGADITAHTADGRRLVVQCKNFAPHRSVWSGEMQKFVGTMTLHHAEAALYVATCPFSREARDIAVQAGVTAVHRGLLEAWSAGTALSVLR
ncbi:restriction endonuclease [Streptomyces sp. AK02-01A]|uniref:restriction endonuclease n=1 Tax=Streptomyces sp. AK02-01A TaxID=3028648 RepID=UPI0029A1CD60|nr:restriction endonuclease [Streptomyces sp. AK02-01A]MDX3850419.1 restriction endonuclease [Streptomyces sp. AK02-01A]